MAPPIDSVIFWHLCRSGAWDAQMGVPLPCNNEVIMSGSPLRKQPVVDTIPHPKVVGYHRGSRHDFMRKHQRMASHYAQAGLRGLAQAAPYLFCLAADPRTLRSAWGSPEPLRRLGTWS